MIFGYTMKGGQCRQVNSYNVNRRGSFMNRKINKAVSAVSALTIALSAFPGLALNAGAASVETDYIGSSSKAESFDSYAPLSTGAWDDAIQDAISGTGVGIIDASSIGGVSGKAFAIRAAGKSGGHTASFNLNKAVTSGKVVFDTAFTPNDGYAHDGAVFTIVDKDGNDVISFTYSGTKSRIKMEVNGGAKPQTDVTDVALRGTKGTLYGISVSFDLDTRKAQIALTRAGEQLTLTANEVGLASGTTIGGLKVTVNNARSGSGQFTDIILDDTKFYSIGEGSASDDSGSSTTPSDVGSRLSIASSDAELAFGKLGGLTLKDGNVSAADGVGYSLSYTKKNDKNEAINIFKENGTGSNAQSITIPFKTLPADGSTVSLYSDVKTPENLFGGLVESESVGTLRLVSDEYLGNGNGSATDDRTYVKLANYTPFAVLTFSTKDKKRMVSINGGEAAEIKDSTVTIPVDSSIANATELFIKANAYVSSDGKTKGTAGSFGTFTVDFPVPQPVNLTTDLTNNNGFLGKVNTTGLVSVDTTISKSDTDGKVTLYGVSAYGAKPSDADKIGEVSIKKGAKTANIKVSASAAKPYIYAVCTDTDKDDKKQSVVVSGAKANYTFEAGINGTDKKAQLDAEYDIVNTQLVYQNADVASINYQSVVDAIARMDAYQKNDALKSVVDENEGSCKSEISYIKQTKEGLDVRTKCANVLAGMTDVNKITYEELSGKRADLNNAYDAYKTLLVAGMRCVDNITTVKNYIDKLEKYDADVVSDYVSAVKNVQNITGLTKTDADGKQLFDAELVNGGNDFETKAKDIEKLNELNAKLSSYDKEVQAAIANEKIDGKNINVAEITADINEKVAEYKEAAAEAFRYAYTNSVKPAFDDAKGDFAKQSAALKLESMQDVYGLISKDTDFQAQIGTEYKDYVNLYEQVASYNTAQNFLEKVAKLREMITNGVTEKTYESISEAVNDTKNTYDLYKAYVAAGIKIDDETAAKVEDESNYIEDAKVLLDRTAEKIIALAKSSVDAVITANTTDAAKKLVNAEYQYKLLGNNAKAYLNDKYETGMTVTDENGEEVKLNFGEKLAYVRKNAEEVNIPDNEAAIAKLINDNADNYAEFINGLNYETLVVETEIKDKNNKVTGYSYSTDEYDSWVNNYKKKVDSLGETNKYFRGTVKSYDTSKKTYSYSNLNDSQDVKDVDASFNVSNKLKTISDFRKTIYKNTADNNTKTKVEETTQSVIDLLYPSGTVYTDIDLSNTELIKEKVEQAYANGVINYSTKLDKLIAEGHDGAGETVTKAFKTAYDNYNTTYKAYTAMFESNMAAADKYDTEEDKAQFEVGKTLYDEIVEYVGAKKAEDEGIENDRLSKVNAANAKAEEIIARINELDNAATVEGYGASTDVDAAKSALEDVNNEIVLAEEDAEGNYTYGETNYFAIPESVKSKLVTIDTALGYWDVATNLYENVVSGIAAADLKNNSYEEYLAASKAVEEAAAQQKVYFNEVAKKNGNENIISDMDKKIAIYVNVNANTAELIKDIDVPTNVESYLAVKPIIDSIDKYLETISDEKATDTQKAENDLYNSAEYADVRECYKALIDKLALIKPAADFTAQVNEAEQLSDTEQYEAVKVASKLYGEMVNKTPEALQYIGKEISDKYDMLLARYRQQLRDDFNAAYDALNKGSLSAPVENTDDAAWLKQVAAVKNAYSGMHSVEQLAEADKKKVLDNIVEDNATYKADKAEAEKLVKAIADTVKAYDADKDADKANKSIADIKAAYNSYAKKYTEAEVNKVVTNYSELDALDKKINGDAEKEKYIKAYEEAVAKLDINNVTLDSYKYLAEAKKAYEDASANGAIDASTGYGVIYEYENKFNSLPEVIKLNDEASKLGAKIDKLPDADAEDKIINEKKDEINEVADIYNELNSSDYGKTLIDTKASNPNVTNVQVEKLNALIKRLSPSAEFDFNGDKVVDIFDLNMAVFAALGKDVKVVDAEGNIIKDENNSEITVKSRVDKDGNGDISLKELKAIINAFSANNTESDANNSQN